MAEEKLEFQDDDVGRSTLALDDDPADMDPEEVLAKVKEQLAKDPNNVRLLVKKANAHKANEDHGDAKAAFNAVLAKEANNVAALFALGEYAMNEKKADEAIAFFGRAIAANPRHLKAHTFAGQLLQSKGSFEVRHWRGSSGRIG